jgi:hypothetical protein
MFGRQRCDAFGRELGVCGAFDASLDVTEARFCIITSIAWAKQKQHSIYFDARISKSRQANIARYKCADADYKVSISSADQNAGLISKLGSAPAG